MHVCNARLKSFALFAARAAYPCGLALLIFLLGSKGLQNAIAEGETRTISMHHMHTGEDITITFKRDGQYDEAALEKLNWFLRDWRRSEQTRMDPHLIDLVWEVHRETGSKDPIWVVCGYRSPQTNAMLRRHSSGVAKFSQHMLGRAMDFYIPGVALDELRAFGLRLQRGGVGFYPTSGSPFVHMDTGNIRMWPRMTRDQLEHVFPDGRTVHVPSDGRPLAGYALALADIRSRGGDVSDGSLETARGAGVGVGTTTAGNSSGFNLFNKLFSSAKDEDDEETGPTATASAAPAPPPAPAAATAQAKPKPAVATAERKPDPKAEAAKAAAAQPKDSAANAAANAKPKPFRLASAATSTVRDAAPPSSSANQIIQARGYWDGLADGAAAAQQPAPVARPAGGAQRAAAPAPAKQVASAAVDGPLSPWPKAVADHVSPDVALAYAAEQPERDAPAAISAAAAPMGATAARPATDQGQVQPPPDGTTIAVKRAANQAVSTILTASTKLASVAKASMHLDSPWLRAVVLSPSVRNFLSTMALGAQDFRALASLMVKPSRSVAMTFSDDPNRGLSHDHFSGSAVVFVSTVSYGGRTASLQ